MQVVGDELVEAFDQLIGDVEEDGAVAFFGSARGSSSIAF